MTYTQQNKRARTLSKDEQNRSLSEELSQVTDLVERRRMQNRISQRNYRNKIRVRLENLEALVEAQNQGKASSDTSSVAGSSSSRSKAASEHGPATTPAESGSVAPSVSAASPPDFSQPPCSCLQENFGFGASPGADLGFLSQSCPHTHPFGGPLSTPGSPPSQFNSTGGSPPSLLGDMDEAESRQSSIPSAFATPSIPAPLDLDPKTAAHHPRTVPGFAVAPADPRTPNSTGQCTHPQFHAPCCGQLVTPYPFAFGMPMLPMNMMPMQQPQGQESQAQGAAGEQNGQQIPPFLPQYLQYPWGQHPLQQGLGISTPKGVGTSTANRQ